MSPYLDKRKDIPNQIRPFVISSMDEFSELVDPGTFTFGAW